jgi:hypothetical protein
MGRTPNSWDSQDLLTQLLPFFDVSPDERLKKLLEIKKIRHRKTLFTYFSENFVYLDLKYFFSFFFFPVLGVKPRVLGMLGKYFTIEL